ncbi:uncharacterized protein LOC131677114 [Topomyia yanbarensis]|uniref:uncharacterized protein LOC131677114 n=1 Tax=Topomyia yanbarensis TaxID=2498891 RepID=UPI00273C2262|nr:uncharacterized protein LOC131677114 [Topomyia yanbarensis]
MNCCVIGCTVTQIQWPTIHFFTMPKEPERRKLWLQRAGIFAKNRIPEKLGRRKLYVCQNHFDESDFHIVTLKTANYNRRYILNKDILPYRNLPHHTDAEKYAFNTPSCSVKQPSESYRSQPSREFEQMDADNTGDHEPVTDNNKSPSAVIQCKVEKIDKNTQTDLPNQTTRTPPTSPVVFEIDQHSVEEKLRYVSFNQKLMKEHSMRYLGVLEDSLYLLDALSEATGLKERDIMMVLRIIRLGESFDIVSDVFGLNSLRVYQIFGESVPKIAREMEDLVCWPSAEDVKRSLPDAFLSQYSSVQSIIDCFGIHVQKCSNPVAQLVTYSQYKSCNTIKYLVSFTPCGLVNFISKGFLGSASKQEIVSKSGYLECIRDGMGVFADSGFKNVAGDIAERGGLLFGPPSISKSDYLFNEDIVLSQEIASVRIHVERLKKRFREYRIAAPHAELPVYFFDKCDSIVKIISGLVNLQGNC